MKISTALAVLLIASVPSLFAQQDVEGCVDSPMFPNRMPNYFISECTSNYDEVDFNLSSDGTKMEHKEGTKIMVRYDFNGESGQQKPSVLQILKNYENASKKIGGVTLFQNSVAAMGAYKLVKNGKETAWVKLECGGSDSNDFYIVTILQLEAMKQDITSADILTALNSDGHIALYINFDTGKSLIKSESEVIVDQISEMLKVNPTLKISIEGHTDNAGVASANQLLSESRAKAVMNALILKGNNKALLSAKGWGQTKPISDNTTDEGRTQNRRVEIVKL